MVGLWFSKIIPVLLVIFTCFRTCLSDPLDFSLPSECRKPANLNAWWSPLVPNFGADPCQLHQNLKNQGIITTCCMGNQLGNAGGCGPCTLDMYNLAVACMACADENLSKSSTVPTIDDDTKINLDHASPFKIPTFSQFVLGNRTLDQYPFPIPPWTNASLSRDLFDPQAVVDLATLSLESAEPAIENITLAATTVITTMTSTNSFEPATTSTPSNTTKPTGNSSPPKAASHAAAIAGGIVGGFLALVLIALGGVLLRRRRRMARMPPSARFVAVTGPGFGYTTSRDEEAPPPFSGDWRMPVSEKVETTTEMQRQYDAGIHRNY